MVHQPRRQRPRASLRAVLFDSAGTLVQTARRLGHPSGELKRIAGELGCTKPDPAICLAASEALAVPPQQTCYVDDQAEMVVAATRLGYHGFVLSRDGAPPASGASLHLGLGRHSEACQRHMTIVFPCIRPSVGARRPAARSLSRTQVRRDGNCRPSLSPTSAIPLPNAATSERQPPRWELRSPSSSQNRTPKRQGA